MVSNTPHTQNAQIFKKKFRLQNTIFMDCMLTWRQPLAVGIFQSIRQSSGEQKPGTGFVGVALIGKILPTLPETWALIDCIAALDVHSCFPGVRSTR